MSACRGVFLMKATRPRAKRPFITPEMLEVQFDQLRILEISNEVMGWRSFFIVDHPLLATLWGPIIGPLVAVISFVCSVGNIPLAAVLWNGGISFGGVIAFIFADLIVLPILNIYRKDYGLKMAAFLFATFYAAMAVAALIVELIFGALGLVPVQRNARVVEASITWDHTTWLNIAFLILAVLLVWRFLKTGGPAMLRMMNRPAVMGHSH